VYFGASAEIRFDLATKRMVYDLRRSEIYDVRLNDRFRFHQNALERLNDIIKIVLRQYMSQGVQEIQLPLDMMNQGVVHVFVPTLPDTPDTRLPVKVVDVAIFDKRHLAIGVDFFEHTGGSFAGISDLTQGAEMVAGLRADAIRQIARFWWERTETEKARDFRITLPVNARRTLAKVSDLLERGITLGVLDPDTEIIRSEFVVDGTVKMLDLPEIEFLSGNRAQISSLKLAVDVRARLETELDRIVTLDTSGIIPDSLTPWEDDRTLSERKSVGYLFNMDVNLAVEVERARCAVKLDDQGRVVLKVTEADVELDLGSRWYENLTDRAANTLLDLLERTIVSRVPEIVISPSLLLSDVKALGYTFDVDVEGLELEPEELAIRCNLGVRELVKGSIPAPLYIGNTKSKRLHRFDCAVVEDIDFVHRRGYHGISEAIRDGLKPCGECLRGYPEQGA
jgi:hypothetical protein